MLNAHVVIHSRTCRLLTAAALIFAVALGPSCSRPARSATLGGDSQQSIEARIESLARSADSEMQQVGFYYPDYAIDDESADWNMPLRRGRCYLFVGAGHLRVEDINLYLFDPDDDRVATEKGDVPEIALVYCPAATGMFHLQAKVGEPGIYAVGLFERAASSDEVAQFSKGRSRSSEDTERLVDAAEELGRALGAAGSQQSVGGSTPSNGAANRAGVVPANQCISGVSFAPVGEVLPTTIVNQCNQTLACKFQVELAFSNGCTYRDWDDTRVGPGVNRTALSYVSIQGCNRCAFPTCLGAYTARLVNMTCE